MADWFWPVSPFVVTDEYGWRIHPIYNDLRLHRGIDLSAYKNQDVHAAHEGWISWAGYNGGEGNSIHINHADGTETKYFHNTSFVRSDGNVASNEHIARAGTTGDSTGVHVHFETHSSASVDSPVNPRGFMAARGVGSSTAGGGSTPIDTTLEGDAFFMGANLSDPVKSDLETIQRDQTIKLWRENEEFRNLIKELVSEALVDEKNSSVDNINTHIKQFADQVTLNLKNVITRERWQLFSIAGEQKLVGINMATGAYTVYAGGITDARLLDDIQKEKISSQIDPATNKRVPDVPYEFTSEEAIESFIDGLKATAVPADV